MHEEWRTIKQFPSYQVSNFGNVRSLTHYDSMNRLRPGAIKKQKKHPKGYLMVSLNHGENVLVHRLVALEFIGEAPEGCEVNHKDGNKRNNIVSNLEWVTKSQNQRHRYDVLKAMPKSQLSGFDAHRKEQMKVRNAVTQEMLNSNLKLREIMVLTGVSISTISRMRRNGK